MQREKLLWELEEKILSFLPINSLVRFKIVCKRWNALINDRRFISNHLARARPQFILLAESKNCSVDVDIDGPSLEVHNFPSYIPGYNISTPINIEYCNGLLIYSTSIGIGICNPWLRDIKWITYSKNCHCSLSGIGYDNSRADNHYKIFSALHFNRTVEAKITEFGSDVWKTHKFASQNWQLEMSHHTVSLHGTLYWVARNLTSYEYFIQSLDFSSETFKPFCILPSKNGPFDAKSLAVFRGDRFSFLEQDYYTRNIDIWVTKKKIKNQDGEVVEWMKFMNVSVPKWSSLEVFYYPPSYFIDDKSLSLVLCCLDKERKAYIYVVKRDKFHEIRINDLVDSFPLHRTYFRSLVPIHTGTNYEDMSGRGETQQDWSRFTVPRGVKVRDGIRGSDWDDGFFNNVKKISVGRNHYGVVFVRFNHSSNKTLAAHGNATHISNDNFMIDDDDYIEAVGGTYTESHITSIAFRLHKRNMTCQYGLQKGTPFVLGGGRGSKIIGFYGKSSGSHLTALGVHIFPTT